jgi:hypothetical protein
MRISKLLVPLLAFALASAILASAAFASSFMVLPEGEEAAYPAEISGGLTESGTEVITLSEEAQLTCKVATLTGEETGASSELAVVPVFEECAQGGKKATIVANGCKYMMHTGAEIGKTGKFEGTTDVVCPKGKVIEASWGNGCKAQFGSETTGSVSINQGLKSIEFENKAGKPADISAKITITGMYFDATVVGQIGCNDIAKGEHTTGKENDTITLIGKVSGKKASFTVSP